MTQKCRYVVLTDVNHGPETDDTQSLTRLLLYADEIDIEGVIVCTSCFQKKRDLTQNAAVVYDLLENYICEALKSYTKLKYPLHASGS